MLNEIMIEKKMTTQELADKTKIKKGLLTTIVQDEENLACQRV